MQGISNVDWPGKVSSVVFFAGCNMRCRFCHNSEILVKKRKFLTDLKEMKKEIEKNIPLIDAVVFSGGEPLLQPEAVEELSKWAKKKGLSVGIETNGTNPETLKKLINLFDYVAMDIKAPLELEFYKKITQRTKKLLKKVKESIKIIKKSNVNYEFKTTLVPDLIDKLEDIQKIYDIAEKNFVLQKFYYNIGKILDKSLVGKEFKKRYVKKLKKFAKERGITLRFW